MYLLANVTYELISLSSLFFHTAVVINVLKWWDFFSPLLQRILHMSNGDSNLCQTEE